MVTTTSQSGNAMNLEDFLQPLKTSPVTDWPILTDIERNHLTLAHLTADVARGTLFNKRLLRSFYAMLHGQALTDRLGRDFQSHEAAGDDVDAVWVRQNRKVRLSLKTVQHRLMRQHRQGCDLVMHNTLGGGKGGKTPEYDFMLAFGIEKNHGLDIAVVPRDRILSHQTQAHDQVKYRVRLEDCADYFKVEESEVVKIRRNHFPDRALVETDACTRAILAKALQEILAAAQTQASIRTDSAYDYR